MRKISTIIAAIGIATSAAAANQAMAGTRALNVPIQIQQYGEGNSCSSTGRVKGLNPNGDGFLSLRSGPGAQYHEISRVLEGQNLIICNDQPSSKVWFAVIVEQGSKSGCHVDAAPYTGPCLSGWVYSKYVGERKCLQMTLLRLAG